MATSKIRATEDYSWLNVLSEEFGQNSRPLLQIDPGLREFFETAEIPWNAVLLNHLKKQFEGHWVSKQESNETRLLLLNHENHDYAVQLRILNSRVIGDAGSREGIPDTIENVQIDELIAGAAARLWWETNKYFV
jgi:hypothetical protein